MVKKINSNPLEIEEIFLDDFLKKRKDNPEVMARKIEFPLKKKTFLFFLIFNFFVLIFILAYAFNLQILNYQKYDELSLKNKFLNLKIKSERGIIYDRNMKQLVVNEVSFSLWEGSVLLKENLSHQELILAETSVDGLGGAEIKKQIQRNYLGEEGLSHILGYLGKISSDELQKFGKDYEIQDYVGKEGIEKEYEKVLAEKKGILEIERDVKGREISKKIKEEPRSGNNLVLSLDVELEKKVREVLEKHIQQAETEEGAGVTIVLDPRNGDILASVSLPYFDNNLFAQGISQKELEELNKQIGNPQLNRVLGGLYPVGSIIKPLLGIAGLEEGIITENTTLFCPLELCVENQYTKELECFADWVFHGNTAITKAIAESVNTFFFMLGGGYDAPKSADYRLPKHFEGLGAWKIKEWLERFGWGQKTEIDLPGEIAGRVPDPDWKESYFKTPVSKKWYLGDTYNLSIGQGYLAITPLQVISAFQSIINDGRIFQPRLVQKIGETILEPKILKQVDTSEKTIDIIKTAMRQAVTSPDGCASYLHSLPIKVGAKTGTAETGKKEVYHNWVVVFAPYENPEIIMLVMVENVKGTRILAQKIAYEILDWYFSN